MTGRKTRDNLATLRIFRPE